MIYHNFMKYHKFLHGTLTNNGYKNRLLIEITFRISSFYIRLNCMLKSLPDGNIHPVRIFPISKV